MENTEKKATPGKIALAIGAVVVLAAILIAIVVAGFGTVSSDVDTEAEVEMVETMGTIPADGNPEDETAKGTYTASDEKVIAAADAVVATMGGYTLTNSQLQVYYWMEVQNFLSSYGSYAAYFGLDTTQPLDTQVCGLTDTGETWQQFFLAGALNSWHNYQALTAEAENVGFELDAAIQAELEAIPETMEQNALLYGFENAEEFLAYNVGNGATIDDYIAFMETYYPGTAYYNAQVEANAPSEEAMEDYFAANQQTYLDSGLSQEDKYVSVRHVLIMPEGADSSTIRSETFDDAAWEASRVRAEELLTQWEQGDKSEDSFATLAMENSQDGSASMGGLYTDIVKGQMVENFENWCFDDSRTYGDYGIVETEFGYHLMFYVSDRPVWTDYVRSDMMNAYANELLTTTLEKYPMEADFANVLLAYVDMTGGAAENGETPEEGTNIGTADKNVLVIAGVSLAALAAAAYVFGKKEHE